MAVGKRIYLKRHMPDKEVMMQFKNIPASNTCDVMGRNAAMNPRIRHCKPAERADGSRTGTHR